MVSLKLHAVCWLEQIGAPEAAPEALLPFLSAGKDELSVAEKAAGLGDKKAARLVTLHSAPVGLRLVPTVPLTGIKERIFKLRNFPSAILLKSDLHLLVSWWQRELCCARGSLNLLSWM